MFLQVANDNKFYTYLNKQPRYYQSQSAILATEPVVVGVE